MSAVQVLRSLLSSAAGLFGLVKIRSYENGGFDLYSGRIGTVKRNIVSRNGCDEVGDCFEDEMILMSETHRTLK